jgi:hypothetical protein
MPSEVKQLLASMSSKSSPLDVIPASLLKMCSETFSGIIADLANLDTPAWKFSNQVQDASNYSAAETPTT